MIDPSRVQRIERKFPSQRTLITEKREKNRLTGLESCTHRQRAPPRRPRRSSRSNAHRQAEALEEEHQGQGHRGQTTRRRRAHPQGEHAHRRGDGNGAAARSGVTSTVFLAAAFWWDGDGRDGVLERKEREGERLR